MKTVQKNDITVSQLKLNANEWKNAIRCAQNVRVGGLARVEKRQDGIC